MIKMKKLVFFFSLIIFTVSSSAIPLDEGWNTLSVNSETSASEIIDSESCDLQTYQNEYIWKYSNELNDWTHPSTIDPKDGFYAYTDNACTLSISDAPTNNIDSINVDSGWKMLGVSYSQLQIVQTECSITPHLSNGDFSFLSEGEWYHPLLTGSEIENRGYWAYFDESCNIEFDSEEHDDSDDPVEESYLKLDEASIVSETVSADDSGLEVEFRFDRDSAVSNDVSADIGVHIDESSSPVESFTVPDESESQTVSVDWETVWEEIGEIRSEDVSGQLVLEENTEGDYRWNTDSLAAGEFNIERCSEFDLNVENDWEFDYDYDRDQCLDEVKVEEDEDNIHDLVIRSNQGGISGELEIRKSFHDTSGSEVLTVNLDHLEDSSIIRTSDIELRHFEGGEDGDGWKTLLDDNVESLEQETIDIEFTESTTGTHTYNIVELTVSNDDYSSNLDPLEIEGSINYEEFSEDGPGTCKPGQTWCGQQHGEGDCIDEDSYSPGLCY